MEPISTLLTDERVQSRRSVIRKAAYSAPVVFAIAAAPKVALGASGPPTTGGPIVTGSVKVKHEVSGSVNVEPEVKGSVKIEPKKK